MGDLSSAPGSTDARLTDAACDECLRRTCLIAMLAGSIEIALRGREHLPELLALEDRDLIAALAGDRRAAVLDAWERFDHGSARRACRAASLDTICGHDHRYPAAVRDLSDPPAVLHVRGGLARLGEMLAEPAVAVVGARRASPYGLEVARAVGRGLASAGVTVVSGMALGADSAAHTGALEARGPTVAVLASGADVPYPAGKTALYRRIVRAGCVVSEMPPGARPWRWGFPARNRIIAALARATVVVEAGERSGSLITAHIAQDLGRDVCAVPGPVTSSLAAGTNALLFDGAPLVRSAQDVLDRLFGAGIVVAAARERDRLPAELASLLDRVRAGRDTVAGLTSQGTAVQAVLAGLAELELRGHLRRGPGGRYLVAAE